MNRFNGVLVCHCEARFKAVIELDAPIPEFLGEVLDLSDPLGAVVLVFLAGLIVWYRMFGGVGIVVLVVGGALMGLMMRPQPFITLDLKPGTLRPEEVRPIGR